MPERRLRVTPLEAAVILTNEVFGQGQYSAAVGKALHGPSWEMVPSRDIDCVRPDLPPERAALLRDTVNTLLTTLQPNRKTRLRPIPSAELLQGIVRMRFGFADGIIHSKGEVGRMFGVTKNYVAYSLEQAIRGLRHPRRSRQLREILEPQLSLPE